jgi:hypothetical protein
VGASFCPGCGQPVVLGATPLAHTPRHLTERILAERAELIGERSR